jgi:hypothetical protein
LTSNSTSRHNDHVHASDVQCSVSNYHAGLVRAINGKGSYVYL